MNNKKLLLSAIAAAGLVALVGGVSERRSENQEIKKLYSQIAEIKSNRQQGLYNTSEDIRNDVFLVLHRYDREPPMFISPKEMAKVWAAYDSARLTSSTNDYGTYPNAETFKAGTKPYPVTNFRTK